VLASPGAKVTYAHVYGGHLGSAVAAPVQFEVAQMLLADAVARAPGPVDSVLIVDSSVRCGLQHVAKRHAADLLVVGASHRRGLWRMVLGDDAAATVRGAPCPVAIAPQGYAQRTRARPCLVLPALAAPSGASALVAGWEGRAAEASWSAR
jgi:nucleotide-binding universal stress UspA family protein